MRVRRASLDVPQDEVRDPPDGGQLVRARGGRRVGGLERALDEHVVHARALVREGPAGGPRDQQPAGEPRAEDVTAKRAPQRAVALLPKFMMWARPTLAKSTENLGAS